MSFIEAKALSCNGCGEERVFRYPMGNGHLCHECLRPIVRAVEKEEEGLALQDSDYIFFASVDRERATVYMGWIMVDMLRRAGFPDYAYAWHKVGIFVPVLPKEVFPFPQKRRHTQAEAKAWHEAVREYRRLKRKGVAD